MKQIVIVGGSLAGLKTAEQLRVQGFAGRVVLIGDEPHAPYDRPPLSKSFASGEVSVSDLDLGASELQPSLSILTGRPAIGLDTQGCEVTLDGGTVIGYDGLVIATGTRPVVPPGLDVSIGGVHLLRTLDDAAGLRESLSRSPGRVAVLGAGFIGVELASTCRRLGIPVTLIDLAERPLGRVLGEEVAQHLLERHRADGVEFRLGVSAVEFQHRGGRVAGVVLSDGTTVTADVVVVAIGVRPATEWLEGSAIEVDDGVLCGPDLSVANVDNAVAVGDVSRWTHPGFGHSIRLEHWSNAVEGAVVAAGTLLGSPTYHNAVPSFWSDQLGLKIQGVGLPAYADDVEVSIDPAEDLFAVYRRRGELIGAVAFGKPRRLMPIRRELGALASSTGERMEQWASEPIGT